MGRPAAASGDSVVGVDLHTVVVPSGPPVLLPHPYVGRLSGGLASTVLVAGRPAAVRGSTSALDSPHVPTAPGTAFVTPADGSGTVSSGSASVFFAGKPAARAGDTVTTCSEAGQPAAVVRAESTVLVG